MCCSVIKSLATDLYKAPYQCPTLFHGNRDIVDTGTIIDTVLIFEYWCQSLLDTGLPESAYTDVVARKI